MTGVDHLIVSLYIVGVFYIAYRAGRFIKAHTQAFKVMPSSQQIEWQYLAGRTLTYVESMVSTVAAEFSSLMFLVIPVLAFKGDLHFIPYFLGAIPARLLFSKKVLPVLYKRGNTFFETMARGIHDYQLIRTPGIQAKQILSSLYFFFKIFSVAAKISLSCVVLAEIYHWPFIVILSLVVLITYLYTLLGGLKAVVWTDILQTIIFVVVGFVMVFSIGSITHISLDDMVYNYFSHQSPSFSIKSFTIGLVGGFLYDLSIHGSDQDFVQKFKATKSLAEAQKSCFNSVLVSFFVYSVFFLVGICFWNYIQVHNTINVTDASKVFTSFIKFELFSPVRGLVVAGLLASMMSSLDSALNALSLTIWNDVLPTKKIKSIKYFVKVDNFIVCSFIILFGHVFADLGYFQIIGLDGLEWILAMMFAFFVIRFLFHRFILFDFAPHTAFLSLMTGTFGILLNFFYFNLSIEFLFLFALVPTIIFFWIYGKLKLYI